MVESAAMLEYIIARYGKGRFAVPVDSNDYPRYLQWLHFAEGSAAPRLITEFLLKSVKGGEASPVAQSQIGKGAKALTYLEDYLTKHEYFGGSQFSLADIMMYFNVQFAKIVARTDMAPYPYLDAWFAKVEERPAFKRMREVALPNGLIGVPKG
jgi:glutathione S-transferase